MANLGSPESFRAGKPTLLGSKQKAPVGFPTEALFCAAVLPSRCYPRNLTRPWRLNVRDRDPGFTGILYRCLP